MEHPLTIVFIRLFYQKFYHTQFYERSSLYELIHYRDACFFFFSVTYHTARHLNIGNNFKLCMSAVIKETIRFHYGHIAFLTHARFRMIFHEIWLWLKHFPIILPENVYHVCIIDLSMRRQLVHSIYIFFLFVSRREYVLNLMSLCDDVNSFFYFLCTTQRCPPQGYLYNKRCDHKSPHKH